MDFGFVDKGFEPSQSRLGWAAARAIEALDENLEELDKFIK